MNASGRDGEPRNEVEVVALSACLHWHPEFDLDPGDRPVHWVRQSLRLAAQLLEMMSSRDIACSVVTLCLGGALGA